jgi:hypothetical protein
LPQDEHVQRVALDAKMAELALLQSEVAAGRIDPQTAADQLNVTVATVRQRRLRFDDGMKQLVHDGTACRLSAIKSLWFGDDHMEFDDFKDEESFMRCRAYDARAPTSANPERQRFEVYLHAFNIICQTEAQFMAAAKPEWEKTPHGKDVTGDWGEWALGC